ncbi:MAG TPA: thiopeptide-type bacteriocin biosynthesis protein, partial [Micromonosporaceae bacterium]|nr:thiopeptide-type bacteriocin biosynthesis protein [Micromonosporaceae bacterium]
SGSPDSGADHDSDLVKAYRTFVDGGLAALRQDRDSVSWLQYDLAFGEAGRRECYPRLLGAARDLLDAEQADDFFFMHKPPGLRIRFHPVDAERSKVDEVVRGNLHAWQRDGLVRAWRPTCYEPETLLFGGPVSMRSVHRLFTADSLVWLAYHGEAVRPGAAPGPAWALSLLMLRALFEGLEIAGWEDLDVWDRVRWQTGRRLNPRLKAELGLEPLTAALRTGWNDPKSLLTHVSPDLHEALAEYRETVAAEVRRWRRDYFYSGEATLGPRAALAYVVIFHWNRAGLPTNRQCLLTEALAAHLADEPAPAGDAR